MSSIDNRVVQMDFDNKRFESNVKTTMSTLDRLKKALNFKDETESLEDFQRASDSFTLNHMAEAVDSIANRFTLLGHVGFQALERIALKAVDAGEKLIKSLSVDQISAGLSKYEQETNSVQAIYAAVKPKGTSLDEVYAELEKLAKYSDETSYSYTQMVDGMSKFIANGIDMSVAEKAMEGIANAAAISGVGIQDASYAFRNFSDALSAGHFMIKDWQSIQNIHMDTEAFKTNVLETAKALGRLDKEGYVVDKNTNKRLSKEAVSIENFRENLRYGFFDTEVMLGVLEKYSDFDWDRVYSGEFKTLGDEAAAAAQNAKTFTDVLDSVKDAASTGWKTTFRLIFGNLEEAIDFFTPMANNIIAVVQEIGDARNALLEGWRNAGGRDSFISALKTVWEILMQIKDEFKMAVRFVFGDLAKSPLLNGNILAAFTKRIQMAAQRIKDWLNGVDPETGATRLQKLFYVFRGAASVVDFVRQIFSGIGAFFRNLFGQLVPTFDAILSFFSSVGNTLYGAIQKLKESGVITKIFNKLADAFGPITSRIPGVIRKLQQLFQNLVKWLKTDPKFQAFWQNFKKAFNSFLDFLPKVIEGAIQFGKSIWNTVRASDEWKWLTANYNKYIKPLGGKLLEFGKNAFKALNDFFTMDTSGEKGLWNKLKKRFGAFEQLGPWFKEQWDKLKQLFPGLQKVEDWWNSSSLVSGIKQFVTTVWNAVDAFFGTDTSAETSLFGKLKKRFEAAFTEFGKWFSEIWKNIKAQFPTLQGLEDFVRNLFDKNVEEQAEEGAQAGLTVMDYVKKFFDFISEIAKNIHLEDIFKIGVAIYAGIRMFQMIKGIKTVYTFVESLGYLVDSMSSFNYASRILYYAAAIALVAHSLKSIGSMPIEQAIQGLVGIGLLMAALMGFYKLMEKVNKKQDQSGSIMHFIATTGIILISVSVLTKAIGKLGQMDYRQLGRGLLGMAGVMALLGTFIVAVNRLSKMKVIEKDALSFGNLIGAALSIWLLARTLARLGNLKWDQVGVGLTGMAGLFVLLGLFTTAVNRFTRMKLAQKDALSFGNLIGTAMAIWLLAKAFTKLGNLKWNQFAIAIASMSSIFALLGVFIVAVSKLTKRWSLVESNSMNFGSLIGIALSVLLLGRSFERLSELSWDRFAVAIASMGSIFALLGTFMIAISKSTKRWTGIQTDALNFGSLIGLVLGIYLLGRSFERLSKLSWSEFAVGIASLGGILLLLGGFVAVLTMLAKSSKVKVSLYSKLASTFGMLGMGVSMVAKAMVDLSKIPMENLLQGFIALAGVMTMLGLFAGIMSRVMKDQKIAIKTAMGMIVYAGAIWLLAQAFMPLTAIKSLDDVWPALVALGGCVLALGILTALINPAMKGSKVHLKNILTIIAALAALALLAVGMTVLLDATKDVSPEKMMAFSWSILILTAALAGVSLLSALLGKIGAGVALKGALALAGVLALIGVGISLFLMTTGDSIGAFSARIAEVGSAMNIFQELMTNVDMDAILRKVTVLGEVALILALIGQTDMGNLDTFRTQFGRIGSSIRTFSTNTEKWDSSKVSIAEDMQKMAESFAKIPELKDVSTSISMIGAALKAFKLSLTDENGENIDFSNMSVPDASALSSMITALQGSLPDDQALKDVSKFGEEANAEGMHQFSLGMIAIATAFSEYSKSLNEANFENIDKGTEALEAITTIANSLPDDKTTVTQIGEFSETLHTSSSKLATLGDDIVILGTSLKSFGDDLSMVKPDDLATGISALEKLSDLQKSLEKIGGVISWFEGENDLSRFGTQLPILGKGLGGFVKYMKEFEGETVDFNIEQVTAAGIALQGIADATAHLPKTGGIGSWFGGDENISKFAKDLGGLGQGVNAFVKEFGDTTISDDVVRSAEIIGALTQAAKNIYESSADIIRGKNLEQLGEDYKKFGIKLSEAQDVLRDIQWADDDVLVKFAAIAEQYSSFQANLSQHANKNGYRLEDLGYDIWQFSEKLKNINLDQAKISQVSEFFNQVFAGMSAGIGELFTQSIVDGMNSEEDGLTTEGENLAKKTSAAINGKVSLFEDAGKNVVTGFSNGIVNNISIATGSADTLAKKTVESLKDVLGIESPSKVFALMGQYSSMGFAIGLTRSAFMAADASKNLGFNVIDSLNNTLGIHSPSVEASKSGANYVKGMAEGIHDHADEAVIEAKKLGDNINKNADGLKDNVKDAWNEFQKITDGSITWDLFRDDYLKRQMEVAEAMEDAADAQKEAAKATESAAKLSSGNGTSRGSGIGSGNAAVSLSTGILDYSADLERVISELQVMGDTLTTILMSLANYFGFELFGADMANGIADGIYTNMSVAIDAMDDLGNEMVEAYRDALGWHSTPDFVVKSVKDAATGFSEEAQKNESIIHKAGAFVGDAFISPIQDTIDGVQDAISFVKDGKLGAIVDSYKDGGITAAAKTIAVDITGMDEGIIDMAADAISGNLDFSNVSNPEQMAGMLKQLGVDTSGMDMSELNGYLEQAQSGNYGFLDGLAESAEQSKEASENLQMTANQLPRSLEELKGVLHRHQYEEIARDFDYYMKQRAVDKDALGLTDEMWRDEMWMRFLNAYPTYAKLLEGKVSAVNDGDKAKSSRETGSATGAAGAGSSAATGGMNTSGALESAVAAGSIDYSADLDRIINELQFLNDQVVFLSEEVNGLQIVMDTGALVGSTITNFDNGFFSRVNYAARGIETST